MPLLLIALAVAAPPASCTAQYRLKPFTNQNDAKAFGRACLVEQGAQVRAVAPAEVATMLETIIPDSDPLTAVTPADIAVFCPRYTTMAAPGRAAVWRKLLGATVKPESGYNTTALLWEIYKDPRSSEFSIGLLQLSLSNEHAYHCGIKSEVDLTDPATNLRCGATILRKRVTAAKAGEQPRIGGDGAYARRFAAAYWSTLRVGSAARAGIVAATRSTPGCVS